MLLVVFLKKTGGSRLGSGGRIQFELVNYVNDIAQRDVDVRNSFV